MKKTRSLTGTSSPRGSIPRRLRVKRLLVDCLTKKLQPNGVQVEAVGTSTHINTIRNPLTRKVVSWEVSKHYDPAKDKVLVKFTGQTVPGGFTGIKNDKSYSVVQKQIMYTEPQEKRIYIMLTVVDTGRYLKKLAPDGEGQPPSRPCPSLSDEQLRLKHLERYKLQNTERWVPSMTLRDCVESYTNSIVMRILSYNLSPRPTNIVYEKIHKVFIHVDTEFELKDKDGDATFYAYHWTCDCFGVKSSAPKLIKHLSTPSSSSSSSSSEEEEEDRPGSAPASRRPSLKILDGPRGHSMPNTPFPEFHFNKLK